MRKHCNRIQKLKRLMLAFALTVVAMTIRPVRVMAGDAEWAKICTEMRDRMMKLSKDRDLQAMEKLGHEIERDWRAADAVKYAHLTLQLCGQLVSQHFGHSGKQGGLSQAFAMEALKEADKIPLELECELLERARHQLDVEGKTPSGEGWAKMRKEQLKLWLHAWQRLEKTIDKNWNPDDVPEMDLKGLEGVSFVSGMTSCLTNDPKLKAKYEAAVEAFRKKREYYSEQHQIRQLMKSFYAEAEQYVIQAYSTPPFNLEELQQALDASLADQDRRASILNTVTKNMNGKKQ